MKKLFKPGESGNPAGRPKGKPNKVTGKLREAITEFLENNFEAVQTDFENLDAPQRVKFYIDLLSFAVPKLQSVSNSYEGWTDDQIDRAINELKATAEGNS